LKTYKTDQLRNVAAGAHGGAGKTSLVEAIIFNMGETNRIGTIEQGTTVSDYNADEIERQISINTSLSSGEWNDHKLNVIDTPGYSDFFGEVVGAFRAVESVLVVVSATGGVEVGTEMIWEEAENLGLPRIIVINKLDKENLNYDGVFESIHDSFGHKVVSAQFPVKVGPGFSSIIDLIRMKLMKFSTDGNGQYSEEAIPDDLKSKADDMHLKLIEAVAESDDSLMERYFEAGELTEDEFRGGLRKAILNHEVFPVFCVSATTNVGVRRLNDVIAYFAPAPSDIETVTVLDKSGKEIQKKTNITESASALVFKTISEEHVGELSFLKVFSGAIKSGDDLLNSTQGKGERVGQLFTLNGKHKKSADRLVAGDIGAVVKLKSTHTGDTLCAKTGEVQFPKIAFPEPKIRTAIIPKAKGDEEKISVGLHALHEEDPTFISQFDPELKQTIISGQGEMHLAIILKRLSQKYHVEVTEEEPKIPYREAIKGKSEAQGKYKKQSGGRGQYGDCHLRLEKLPRGSGFEFVDAIVGGVIPGKFVPAVEKGVVERMEKGVLAGFKVIDVRVTCFDGSYHNVDSSEMAFKVAASMGFQKAFQQASPVLLEPIYDITIQVIRAKVPLGELFKYSTALRSMTSGRGIHKRAFSNYDEVPSDIAEKIIAQAKKEKEEES
jgi:elongation factor G